MYVLFRFLCRKILSKGRYKDGQTSQFCNFHEVAKTTLERFQIKNIVDMRFLVFEIDHKLIDREVVRHKWKLCVHQFDVNLF